MRIRELLFEVIDIDQTYQRYSKKIAQRLELNDNDPELESKVKEFLNKWKDDNKQLNNTYTLWLLTHWLNQNIQQLEDVERARSYVETFEKNKGKVSQDKRDINKYVPFESSTNKKPNQLVLQSEMDKFIQDNPVDEVLLARDIAKAKKEIKIIHSDNQVTIFQPLTELAASVFGRDTDWCTAYGYKFGKHPSLTNRFDDYNQRGPMFIFIFSDKTKYQLSNSGYQFADVKDKSVESLDVTKRDSLRFLPEDEINGLAKWNFSLIPNDLKTPERCLLAIQNDIFAFKYLPDELKTPNFYLAAVQRNVNIFRYIPDKFKTEDVCLAAVQKDGQLLRVVPDKFKTPDICLAAVTEDHHALKYLPDELKTRNFYLAAIQQNNYALRDTPNEFKTPQFYLDLVKQNFEKIKYMLYHTPNEFKTPQFYLELVKQNAEALEYVPNKLQDKIKQELRLPNED